MLFLRTQIPSLRQNVIKSGHELGAENQIFQEGQDEIFQGGADAGDGFKGLLYTPRIRVRLRLRDCPKAQTDFGVPGEDPLKPLH